MKALAVRRWVPTLAALALVEVGLIALHFDTVAAMVEIWWRSGTFNHAFLVPPISLWLVWRKRGELAGLVPRPAPRWLLPFALAAFVWLLGALTAVNAATQFALVAMLVLAVPLLIGSEAARRILFPLAFLLFAVPFGEFVMPTLMQWTAKFTVLALRATGIPVYQEGLHFVIPSGRWSVVEACSGVRYLIASIVVGTLFAYLHYHGWKRRLLFVLFAIAVPLVANWLRAYLIVLLGHLSGNTLAVGIDHLIYGWAFFGVVMLVMFAIGLRWREPEEVRARPAEERPVEAAQAPSALAWTAALLVGIALAPWLAYHRITDRPPVPPPEFTAEKLATAGWRLVESPPAKWRPAYENPLATYETSLEKDGRRIGVFIAWYEKQDFERKLISSVNQLVKVNDRHWTMISSQRYTLVLAKNPVTIRVGVLGSLDRLLGSDPQRLTVWHWYWIHGRIVAEDALGKLWLALDQLLGRGDASAAVFLYALEPGADEVLRSYLAEGGESLLAELTAMARRP